MTRKLIRPTVNDSDTLTLTAADNRTTQQSSGRIQYTKKRTHDGRWNEIRIYTGFSLKGIHLRQERHKKRAPNDFCCATLRKTTAPPPLPKGYMIIINTYMYTYCTTSNENQNLGLAMPMVLILFSIFELDDINNRSSKNIPANELQAKKQNKKEESECRALCLLGQ
ncbi:hypothetical protein BaRGS_00033117 [Batillaria attramentaria]|uniref:Uncharacterized protein n=1 Tax=Batillaria attramentaria TaxID=370345 RepID=A0ABD0JKX0_9CAEN